jgi:outer membrane protein assembly factor BamE (lipoprotein component of BamABCDE complex)
MRPFWSLAARTCRQTTLIGVLMLGGCSLLFPPPQVRGNRVDATELQQLKPGTSTQTDVASLLGSPTAKGTFDQNNWYYISETTRPVIAGTQSVLRQEVVVLNFNSQGVLQRVQALDQKDALNVPIVGRTTPSPGTEATFLQQLLGNIGRFTPNAGPNQQGGGGAPNLE